jgi:hypothetical protein
LSKRLGHWQGLGKLGREWSWSAGAGDEGGGVGKEPGKVDVVVVDGEVDGGVAVEGGAMGEVIGGEEDIVAGEDEGLSSLLRGQMSMRGWNCVLRICQ